MYGMLTVYKVPGVHQQLWRQWKNTPGVHSLCLYAWKLDTEQTVSYSVKCAFITTWKDRVKCRILRIPWASYQNAAVWGQGELSLWELYKQPIKLLLWAFFILGHGTMGFINDSLCSFLKVVCAPWKLTESKKQDNQWQLIALSDEGGGSRDGICQ